MIYFDTSYLVRLYFDDPGFAAVRALAATAPIACSQLGRAEIVAALHRKLREGTLRPDHFRIALAEFRSESEAGAFRWLPLSPAIIERVEKAYVGLAATVFLRAADAIHLASAADNRFREIHATDGNLLAAAPHFGLRGVNVI